MGNGYKKDTNKRITIHLTGHSNGGKLVNVYDDNRKEFLTQYDLRHRAQMLVDQYDFEIEGKHI
jgi:hypothetical protein